MHSSCNYITLFSPRRSAIPSLFDFKRSFVVQPPTSKHRYRSNTTNHSMDRPELPLRTISIFILEFSFFVYLFWRIKRISLEWPSSVFVQLKWRVRRPALYPCELYVSFRRTFPLSALFCVLHRRRLCSFIFYFKNTHKHKEPVLSAFFPTITLENPNRRDTCSCFLARNKRPYVWVGEHGSLTCCAFFWHGHIALVGLSRRVVRICGRGGWGGGRRAKTETAILKISTFAHGTDISNDNQTKHAGICVLYHNNYFQPYDP